MVSTRIDRLPCITYFYAKTDQRPKTGVEPFDPNNPDRGGTGRITDAFIWARIRGDGTVPQSNGIQSVSRIATGIYEIRLGVRRINEMYLVVRFPDDAVPQLPQRGPYSTITDKTNRSFTINWYDRMNRLIDTNFVIGIYS